MGSLQSRMRPSLVLGSAALICGAVGQSQYRPGGSGGGASSGGSSGSFGAGSNGGSAGSAGPGNSFNSPSGFGGGAGSNSQGGFGGGNGGDEGEGGQSGSLEEAIPGIPGDDYPILAEVPETSFLCDGQADGGYYADPESECQAFHICANDGNGGRTKYSFLCPNGTIFQQQYFVRDWWFNVDCSLAESLYYLNDDVAAERSANSPAGLTGDQNPEEGSQGSGRRGQGGSKGGAGGRRGSASGSQGSASSPRGSFASPDGFNQGSGSFDGTEYGAPGSGSLSGYGRRRNTRDLVSENQAIESPEA